MTARVGASALVHNSGVLKVGGGTHPERPNTPVLPLESVAASATFIDPSAQVLQPRRIALGSKDYVAPHASLDARGGYIKVGSSSTVQDNASLVASPSRSKQLNGIFIGDNVVIGSGATILGPSAIGTFNGAAATIGAGAEIDGGIVQAGAYVGALARVGPGVTIASGYRVLPGANVTTQAEAFDPSLGKVALVTAADGSATNASTLVGRNVALAAGYTQLYQGQSATGPGASSTGPVASPLASTTNGVYFGNLSTVLGVSAEPTSRFVSFEPSSGTPTFLDGSGKSFSLDQNTSFRFPARVIGQVRFAQTPISVASSIGRLDSIRADEGQPIYFAGPIGSIGSRVTIHSPLGGVRGTTTTTTVTRTTVNGATTTTTNSSISTTMAAPTATAGTTTSSFVGTNASGQVTNGTVTTVVATSTTLLGAIAIGQGLRVGDGATILGGPSAPTIIEPNVTVGVRAVVDTSTLGEGVVVGNHAYVVNSYIAPGTVIPDGALIVNGRNVGTVQWS